MSHNARAHARAGQPSDQVTEVGRGRRRPPPPRWTRRYQGTRERGQSDTESHLEGTAGTILSSWSQTSHLKTYSQTHRGLPDGQCENSHHRKASTPTRRPTRPTPTTPSSVKSPFQLLPSGFSRAARRALSRLWPTRARYASSSSMPTWSAMTRASALTVGRRWSELIEIRGASTWSSSRHSYAQKHSSRSS